MTSQQSEKQQEHNPQKTTSTAEVSGDRKVDAITRMAIIRKRLAAGKGREFWRSLDDLAETEDFREFLDYEFPRQADLARSVNRRDFLKIMGASLVMAGLSACTPTQANHILPAVIPPETGVPGNPVYYASTLTHDGYARGVLVKTDEGRPIKIEGNPRHPLTQGSSDMWMQASILDLWDPDRAQGVTNRGKASTWNEFVSALTSALASQTGSQGAGIHILTGTVTSPTFADQMKALLTLYPQAHWHAYTPVSRDAVYAGTQILFGKPAEPQYHFERADVILSLDEDFVLHEPGSIRYMKDFSNRREVRQGGSQQMNRLYVIESSLTNTGSMADHRLPVKASQVEAFARAVANRLGVNAGNVNESGLPGANWLDPLVADLKQGGKAALVIAGEHQPAAVHALAHAMNQALGSAGNTVVYTEPVPASPTDQAGSINQLAQDLNAGRVDVLVILEGNPAYAAPVDLDFARRLAGAKFSAYLGAYADETAALCQWHVAATHELEMWSDARTYDGTVSIIQPAIDPLYGGRSPHEMLAAVAGHPDLRGYDIVRTYWQGQLGSTDFETGWEQALVQGIVANTALPAQTLAASGSVPAATAPANASPLELVFEIDPTIWDGRFANNSWLQELPKPITKLTWDNAVLISPATAERLNISDHDVLQLSYKGRQLEAAALIQPGQPADSLALSLGYGRKLGGHVLEGTGFNAYALRTSDAPWFGPGLEIRKMGGTYELATTRDHWSMEGRQIAVDSNLVDFKKNPAELTKDLQASNLPSLYPENPHPGPANGHAWGMVVDMSKCTGCNACVLACQAENNSPTVGKDQVSRSREMHWLRVDRYFKGGLENPQVVYQPLFCVHCEKAPCEYVCPVQATSHSAEGINEMTYNRCVGTKYCSNNCPYKVRRFNWYDYTDTPSESLKAMRNPDVTVRRRGVMEKCNYCVQRVNRARIQEQVSGQPLQDGQLMTACQQACPAGVIVFGDLNDQKSQVRSLKTEPQNYSLLADLGTLPRTTHMAKIRNPNPSMPG